MAFDRGIPVVPVLLDHTPLPEPAQSPAESHAEPVDVLARPARQVESDVRGLIDGIENVTGGAPAATRPQPTGINSQHNHASGRSQIIVNQGGNQTVNLHSHVLHLRRSGHERVLAATAAQ